MNDDSASRATSVDSPSEEQSSSYVMSSEEDDDASSNWSDVGVSESSSFDSTRGKKRRKLESEPPPPRPDNVQTRKLRPPQHLRQQKPATPSAATSSTMSSPEPELVREVTPEEAERDLAANHLQLTAPLPRMDEIEQAIVKSSGQGLLAHLHIDLMKGLKPRVMVDMSNWTTVLSRKLRMECLESKDNPFEAEKGNEVLEYCNAPAEQRVLALKLLCDMRCSEADMRDLFDDCLKPIPRTLTHPRKRQKHLDSRRDLLRSQPLGQLNALTYFWLVESSEWVDFRLYREVREHIKKNGKIRGYTRVREWDLVAADLETLIEFGEQLEKSGTHSRNLRRKILDDVAPRLEKQMCRDARRKKAEEKIRQRENHIILDEDGGFGRSSRTRTEAKYTFEEYERAMAEAIDEGRVKSDGEEAYLTEMSDDVTSVTDAMSYVEEANGHLTPPREGDKYI